MKPCIRVQRGAALLELQIVAMLALLPTILGIVQMALLSSAYHLLGYAAVEAARAGAVGNARLEPMYTALAAGLTGLPADLGRLTGGSADATEVAAARLRAEIAVREHGRIERLNPTAADFEDFVREREGRRGIPNDSLEYRSSAPGSRSGHSVPEANWLRIRVTYCHPLVVPVIDRLLPPLLRSLDRDPLHQRCYLTGRVPLAAVGSLPMQTEAWP